MIDKQRVQWLHDMIHSILELDEECDGIFPDEKARAHVTTVHDTLCWVLGHNDAFDRTARQMEADFAKLGFVLVNTEGREVKTRNKVM